MEDDKIIIKVKDGQFSVSKQALCERSKYFQAMFSGNFREHNQQEITLNNVDAVSMTLIIKHLSNIQNLDLDKYTLSNIYNLAEAANFHLLTELANTIESFLILQKITTRTWFKFRNFIEHMNYVKLKQILNEFGLPPLRDMKPQYVPSVQELVWYLSQTHLYVINEYDVFKFGLDWMSHSNNDIDSETVLMLLGCLDMNRVTNNDLIQIRVLCRELSSDCCLALDVVQCLMEVSKNNTTITAEGIKKVAAITENIENPVCHKAMNLVEYNKSRQIEHTIIVPVKDRSQNSNSGAKHKLCMFTHAQSGLNKWLDLPILESTRYSSSDFFCDSSWDIAAWGPRNLVLVINSDCIEADRFFPFQEDIDIRVYNVLTKKWTSHDTGTAFPRGLISKIAVVEDSLYIMCKGGKSLIYNLGDATWKTIAKLPFQKDYLLYKYNCTHKDEVYVSNESMVYKYDGTVDVWVKIIQHSCDIYSMASRNDDYIYVTDEKYRLSKFKPGKSKRMTIITKMNDFGSVLSYCLEDRQLFFTFDSRDTIKIMKYDIESDGERSKIKKMKISTSKVKKVWSRENSPFKIDPRRNVCSLVMTTPTIDSDVREYLKRHLMRYNEQKM